MKKHILIVFVGSMIGIFIAYYLNYNYSYKGSWPIALLISGIYGATIAYITYYTSIKLDKTIPWKHKLSGRITAGILINFITVYIPIYIGIMLYNTLNITNIETSKFHNNLSIKLCIIIFILTLIYNVLYLALYSYYSYTTLQIETIKHENRQIDLQLRALKSQLSPHFLFNNLNTISSLSFLDGKKAEAYIRDLFNIYSYTLNSYESKLVILSQELDFVNSYLELIQTRYGEVFDYTIDIPEGIMRSKIPPLTLQMLIENAIKHNMMDTENLLNIAIYTNKGCIVIRNNITKTPSKVSSFKIGLNNIDSRYKLLTGKGIDIIQNDNFTVKIPLIL
ncbi:MAG: histidine kinase [Flavobacteriaceae bacterium]|nr:histidine kinase [Flavobacteriaceae bacterium]